MLSDLLLLDTSGTIPEFDSERSLLGRLNPQAIRSGV
jgi:hypothetical protein